MEVLEVQCLGSYCSPIGAGLTDLPPLPYTVIFLEQSLIVGNTIHAVHWPSPRARCVSELSRDDEGVKRSTGEPKRSR